MPTKVNRGGGKLFENVLWYTKVLSEFVLHVTPGPPHMYVVLSTQYHMGGGKVPIRTIMDEGVAQRYLCTINHRTYSYVHTFVRVGLSYANSKLGIGSVRPMQIIRTCRNNVWNARRDEKLPTLGVNGFMTHPTSSSTALQTGIGTNTASPATSGAISDLKDTSTLHIAKVEKHLSRSDFWNLARECHNMEK
ncbi:hypothetical protein K504DRAFT_449939 [Pleomassaria siparia CBS 279.74]|uniref:Uncharacterized protein n=1 Tax=Pleomassaria siparia CBS 279.74 TaxID=1314801 RepID=A0A6G1KJX8_9PLEO|nr:hypothetical protein K504DRAFT_449939 [Pleomassaria siparia CBS 279.74]